MRRLQLLAGSRIGWAAVGWTTVGWTIAIGLTSVALAKEPKSVSSPMTPTASPTTPTRSVPTAKLSTTLAPNAEVPATSVKGTGSVTVNVYSKENKVCYRVSVSGLSEITGAHIHSGLAGKNGPVVIPFNTPGVKGLSIGCAAVKPELLQDLASNPSHYYVNVHTKRYDKGAIRGQLAVASATMMQP